MSSRQIVEHGHCEICGRVVRLDKRFCGEECEEQHEANVRQKRRQMWLLLAVLVGVILFVNAGRWGLL